MPDETSSENQSPVSPDVPVFIQGERRQAARRQSGRQGKYDRRRNRCRSCAHFQASMPSHCRFHDIPMQADAFACLEFESGEPG